MICVLLSLDVVLEEDLNLVVHLWAYILKEEGSDDSQGTECKGRESDFSIKLISNDVIVEGCCDAYLTAST